MASTAIPGWAMHAIIQAGLRMDVQGWVPATAGNVLVRLADGRVAITCSGTHKGLLDPGGVMLVDASDQSLILYPGNAAER